MDLQKMIWNEVEKYAMLEICTLKRKQQNNRNNLDLQLSSYYLEN